MERRRDSDRLQHLAEQLPLHELGLHRGSAHKPVLTQQLLGGAKASTSKERKKKEDIVSSKGSQKLRPHLHPSERRLTQLGVLGLQRHLEGQQTALPAGTQAQSR